MTRVLGIDPGTASVGYGIVDELADGRLVPVAFGVIRTTPDNANAVRLNRIYEGITDLCTTYQPDRAAVEELFFGKNVTTAITVSQGRGVILLALYRSGLRIREHKPNAVKQAISGYGGAAKPQIQEMVRILLNLETIPRPDDAADGLAIAITDLQTVYGESEEEGSD
jgi:crossover junction endodeoxyribonuclease RuvC